MSIIRGMIDTREVYIDAEQLLPNKSQKLRNHSPDGFMWGYGGSGPAQLALALLLKFADEDFATKNYQKFKWDIIAKLPQTDFHLAGESIQNWIRCEKEKEAK